MLLLNLNNMKTVLPEDYAQGVLKRLPDKPLSEITSAEVEMACLRESAYLITKYIRK